MCISQNTNVTKIKQCLRRIHGIVCMKELCRLEMLQIWAAQSVVCGPAASASPGNLLEMPIFRPHSSPTESEALKRKPKAVSFSLLPGSSDAP